MSVKVTDNSAIVKLRVDSATSLFLRFLIEDVHRFARPVTPKDQGHLRDDVLKQVLGKHGRIEWRKQYAAPQEAGFVGPTHAPVRRYTTPGTGPHYAERAVKSAIAMAPQTMKRAGLTT